MKHPLSTLLSQALVAFTIEFDNEFEHRMPHRTTNHRPTAGAPRGPWLVSMAMWSNCMQHVGEDGVRIDKLERLARTPSNLNGMQRWGYIVVEPDSGMVRATAAGRQAQQLWRPLFGIIEKRWEQRFGAPELQRLRKSLEAVANQFEIDLPDCLPILGYGLFSRVPNSQRRAPAAVADLPLSALLSRVLLSFAMDFERESKLSLAICANLLRVLDENGVRSRDLPMLAGVSKEAIAMALGILQKRDIIISETKDHAKIVRLTAKGRDEQAAYRRRLSDIEERWLDRFGDALHDAIEHFSGDRLLSSVTPYPDDWRASVRKPVTLPHYPMVLHRGGFPDGS